MILASFGNLLGMDSLIIILAIMLIFGGKKLPELGRSVGTAMREFRRGKEQPPVDHDSL